MRHHKVDPFVTQQREFQFHTGAIVGMICGAYYGCKAIPERWLKAMDDEVIIQCRDQTKQLIQLSPRYRALEGESS